MALTLAPAVAAIKTRISSNARCTEVSASKSGLLVVAEKSPATPTPSLVVGRREGLSASFTALTLSLAYPSLATILEADDDEELLEKVKNDRKKRLQRQGVISSSAKETGYLQELVYKLSKVGKAIENNDLTEASSVLGSSIREDWVQNVNVAFAKLTSNPEEKSEVDAFNSSLASLISSVDKREIELSKSAFVSSASALVRWVESTGLGALLKGL
ncbi:thylakoid lumenal 16.5 kDa protein, chloroplastic [Phalaenopsis equestris]|uniref:thylakoid lumenal 16.5 kDa protein, chloroplastic n=1 Tax=Phalaenopsis equestris TaxID=78828 RepID=UPI0009E348E5|nr:thylakoid lumenal 16.5 kDa protein, chloroplastic [Phalaenopsis equestris]